MIFVGLPPHPLADVSGRALLVRVQTPEMEAKGGLILAMMCTGATLAVALVVQMVHGQAMLLKGLAVSVLIAACLFFIFKMSLQSAYELPLCINATEAIKQLGWMYVATFVMGLGVSLMPAWIGGACVAIAIFLTISTVRLIPLQEDIDKDGEDLDETDEIRQRSVG